METQTEDCAIPEVDIPPLKAVHQLLFFSQMQFPVILTPTHENPKWPSLF